MNIKNMLLSNSNIERQLSRFHPIFLILCLLSILPMYAVGEDIHVSNTAEFQTALLDAAESNSAVSIILGEGVYSAAENGGPFYYSSSINPSLTIAGIDKDKVIINGNEQFKGLMLNGVTEVTVSGVTVRSSVGGIESEVALTIEDSEFTSNHNPDGRGGAIRMLNRRLLVIRDSRFINNTAEFGGAIWSEFSQIEDSYFIANNATREGDAITFPSTSSWYETSIIRSTFIGNGNKKLDENNTIYALEHKVTIEDSLFLENHARTIVYALRTLTIKNSSFKNNSATRLIGTDLQTSLAPLILYNSSFINNSVDECMINAVSGSYFGNIFSEETASENTAICINIRYNKKSSFSNNLFHNFEKGISLASFGTQDVAIEVVNSVFLDVGTSVYSPDDIDVAIKNNYVEQETVDVAALVLNTRNIYSDVDLSFIDISKNNYSLNSNSDLIGAGTVNHGLTGAPELDINKNPRISYETIDIGPVEYIDIQNDVDSDGISDENDNDQDNDGMHNDFEEQYFLDPFEPSDSALDNDADGYSNKLEFLEGTNPLNSNSYPFYLQKDIQTVRVSAFDFDGDGKSDVAVRRPNTFYQYILNSSDSDIQRVMFGRNENDISVSGDFDGDGKADVAVRRPSNQMWYVLNSSNNEIQRVNFGKQEEDIPVPADYDGDGVTDIAVRRPSNQTWYILNSSNNEIQRINFGKQVEDIPVPADYDGDGKADIAVRRPSNQMWYILNSSNGEIQRIHFGRQADDIPVPADYDGDKKTDIAVRRPSNQMWYILNTTNNEIQRIQFGKQEGDIPIPADYDGDGKADVAVRRPSTHYQYILNSSDNKIQRIQFGRSANDIPLAAPINTRMNWINGNTELFPRPQDEEPRIDILTEGEFEVSIESSKAVNY